MSNKTFVFLAKGFPGHPRCNVSGSAGSGAALSARRRVLRTVQPDIHVPAAETGERERECV